MQESDIDRFRVNHEFSTDESNTSCTVFIRDASTSEFSALPKSVDFIERRRASQRVQVPLVLHGPRSVEFCQTTHDRLRFFVVYFTASNPCFTIDLHRLRYVDICESLQDWLQLLWSQYPVFVVPNTHTKSMLISGSLCFPGIDLRRLFEGITPSVFAWLTGCGYTTSTSWVH